MFAAGELDDDTIKYVKRYSQTVDYSDEAVHYLIRSIRLSGLQTILMAVPGIVAFLFIQNIIAVIIIIALEVEVFILQIDQRYISPKREKFEKEYQLVMLLRLVNSKMKR